MTPLVGLREPYHRFAPLAPARPRHPPAPHRPKARRFGAKLTAEQVEAIRIMSATRLVTQAWLARWFGVSDALVSHIIHGRRRRALA